MKKIIFILAAALATALTLTSCNSKPTITVYNWGDYIDEEVCADFEAETGIRVRYDTFDTNETMYTKVSNNPSAYDILIPSDYMIERMAKEGLLAKLNMDNIPNAANIDSRFKNLPCDPNNEYVVTYMWGTVGIMYNSDRVGPSEDDPFDSWDVLWNPKYSKRIFMLESVRDTIGLALKYLGYSLNSRDIDQINRAKALLIEQYPLTLAYVGDTVKDKMIGNEGDIAVCYSGDAMFTQSLNPSIEFMLPKEGTNIWYDGMVITAESKNKENAELFINYLCRADIAARNSVEIGYTTTNRAALEYVDDEIKNNPIYWPSDEILDSLCEMFYDLEDFKAVYDNAWTDILIGQ